MQDASTVGLDEYVREVTEFPRTLLLTLGAPDAKYKVIRPYADKLPPEKLCWCSIQPPEPGAEFCFRYKAFTPKQPYWRLRFASIGQLYFHELQASRLAREIEDWVRDFNPELLWILPEMGAASVGYRLARRLGIPLHTTSHDAHETALYQVPSFFYYVYAHRTKQVFSLADSLDAVAAGLVDYVCQHRRPLAPEDTLVVAPSMDRRWIPPEARPVPNATEGGTRRIGLCGSMRIGESQWAEFVQVLGKLPYDVEIIAFAYKDMFYDVPLPENITVSLQPFAETRTDLMKRFCELEVDAFYLGLWKEESRGLFGRTSLSAKLGTYVACGRPIIVDAREDSVAWQLVKKHAAGILLDKTGQSNLSEGSEKLNHIFSNADVWYKMAIGSVETFDQEFDLDRNVANLKELMKRTARKGSWRGSKHDA